MTNAYRHHFDQAYQLRRLVRVSAGRARVVSLVSGKGGVGKSNIAANLAVSLAQAGRSVVLIDADLALANLDILFNIPPGLNLSHLLKSPRNTTDVIIEITPGLRLLPGASGLTFLAEMSDFQRAQLLNLFEQLQASADFLIIDASAGLSANVLSCAAAADDVLVVTTPEPTAVTDAYAVIKVLLSEMHLSGISLVVNMAKNISQVRSVHSRIAHAAGRFLGFDLSLAGSVLSDRHVRLAVNSRRPFMWSFPRCCASRCVRRLAKHLLRLDRVTCPELSFMGLTRDRRLTNAHRSEDYRRPDHRLAGILSNSLRAAPQCVVD